MSYKRGDRDGTCVEPSHHQPGLADTSEDVVYGAIWLPEVSPHPWDGYLNGPENELAMAAAQASLGQA